jgi:type III restriction enzyme
MRSSREIVKSDGMQMSTVASNGVQYAVLRPIPYGVFLSRITRVTSIPISVLHAALIRYCQKHGQIDPQYINENSASAFCAEFQNWKVSKLQGRFRYVKSGVPCGATALSYADGTPREEITQGRIGTKIVEGTPSAKYLYDAYAYDSPLEKDNLLADIEEVVVFGKIPRSSIAIPTIAGGTYSPDFMYIVRKANGEKELNIVVETKGVDSKDTLRKTEDAKIECAKVFFENLSRDGFVVHFRDQINNKQMKQIIQEVLRQ